MILSGESCLVESHRCSFPFSSISGSSQHYSCQPSNRSEGTSVDYCYSQVTSPPGPLTPHTSLLFLRLGTDTSTGSVTEDAIKRMEVGRQQVLISDNSTPLYRDSNRVWGGRSYGIFLQDSGQWVSVSIHMERRVVQRLHDGGERLLLVRPGGGPREDDGGEQVGEMWHVQVWLEERLWAAGGEGSVQWEGPGSGPLLPDVPQWPGCCRGQVDWPGGRRPLLTQVLFRRLRHKRQWPGGLRELRSDPGQRDQHQPGEVGGLAVPGLLRVLCWWQPQTGGDLLASPLGELRWLRRGQDRRLCWCRAGEGIQH